MGKVYAAIDLKSFYASVECVERGLDPLTTNLVVADQSRTDKTICLAISPSLKGYGLPGRARLFEVISKVRQINLERQLNSPLQTFLGQSYDNQELLQNPNLKLDYIVATPRMKYYLDYSSKIYQIYLQHLAPEDIFAYSVDEVFCDITSYLKRAKLTPSEFVTNLIMQVYRDTGITATAGIGTNLFLAKVAMDILAKHAEPNSAGVRIASLDEISFRKQLWSHTPITDFWRVGRGYQKRLKNRNLYTMGDIARCSLDNSELLYKLFGINAELLIDHAWGYEPTEIKDVKNHIPETKSISSGQVLSQPYPNSKARIIVKEMAEALSLELVEKNYLTDQLVLHVNYDHENTAQESVIDHYGRTVPKPAHGTYRLPLKTSSTKSLVQGFLQIFDRETNPNFTIRKITVCASNLIDENVYQEISSQPELIQTDIFTNYAELERQAKLQIAAQKREHNLQKAVIKIRKRYGTNAILRGTNFEDGATGITRHRQIGGHRAWTKAILAKAQTTQITPIKTSSTYRAPSLETIHPWAALYAPPNSHLTPHSSVTKTLSTALNPKVLMPAQKSSPNIKMNSLMKIQNSPTKYYVFVV